MRLRPHEWLRCSLDGKLAIDHVVGENRTFANRHFFPGLMSLYLTTAVVYIAAALAEIAGCFAFWAWLRMDKSVWWIAPGVISLVAFGYLLTLAPSEHAGRAYAAYGGVYIVASVLWLWLAEGHRPDRWDVTGGALSLVAVAIILFAPRGSAS